MRYKNYIETLNSILKKIKGACFMKDQQKRIEFLVTVLMNLGAHQNIIDNEFYKKKAITKEEHEKLLANIDFLKRQCMKIIECQRDLNNKAA